MAKKKQKKDAKVKPMRMAARIAGQAARKYLKDDSEDAIKKAATEAERKIRQLPAAMLKTLLPDLISLAIRGLVTDARHTYANKLKARFEPAPQMRPPYMGQARVRMGAAAGQQAALEIWYDMPFDGVRLGSMTRKQLEIAAENEAAKAEGHALNSKLAQALMKRMRRATDTVERCWSEKELGELWRSLQPSKQARRFRRRAA